MHSYGLATILVAISIYLLVFSAPVYNKYVNIMGVNKSTWKRAIVAKQCFDINLKSPMGLVCGDTAIY